MAISSAEGRGTTITCRYRDRMSAWRDRELVGCTRCKTARPRLVGTPACAAARNRMPWCRRACRATCSPASAPPPCSASTPTWSTSRSTSAAACPPFDTVGLPQGAVREGKERVNAALANAGYSLPLRRITVNLAPADVPKQGSAFDLPIALGVLIASEQLPVLPDAARGRRTVVAGELGLEGDLRPVRGALPIALAARASGCRRHSSFRRRTSPRPRWWTDLTVLGAAIAGRRLPAPVPVTPTGARRGGSGPLPGGGHARRGGFRRRAGAGGCQAGAGGGGGRRAQHPAHRSARLGQDHARPPAPGHPSRACRSTRRWRPPRCTAWPGCWARAAPSAPHVHSARRITPSATPASSAAARRRGPAR